MQCTQTRWERCEIKTLHNAPFRAESRFAIRWRVSENTTARTAEICFLFGFFSTGSEWRLRRRITNRVIGCKLVRWSIELAGSPAETPSWWWLVDEEKTRDARQHQPQGWFSLLLLLSLSLFFPFSLTLFFFFPLSTSCAAQFNTGSQPATDKSRASLSHSTQNQTTRWERMMRRRKNVFQTAAVNAFMTTKQVFESLQELTKTPMNPKVKFYNRFFFFFFSSLFGSLI